MLPPPPPTTNTPTQNSVGRKRRRISCDKSGRHGCAPPPPRRCYGDTGRGGAKVAVMNVCLPLELLKHFLFPSECMCVSERDRMGEETDNTTFLSPWCYTNTLTLTHFFLKCVLLPSKLFSATTFPFGLQTGSNTHTHQLLPCAPSYLFGVICLKMRKFVLL